MYVATTLSDSTIKIEKWSTAVANNDEYPLEYEKDVSTITIDGESVTPSNGDIAFYGTKEFIFAAANLFLHKVSFS